MDQLHVIKSPLLTEKLDTLREEQTTYAFKVDKRASKHDVKAAIERMFKVHVEDVRTLVVRGKTKRVGAGFGQQANWKKALVRLRDGEKLDIFEGGA
jgi:large subunit ribosomal protein L23